VLSGDRRVGRYSAILPRSQQKSNEKKRIGGEFAWNDLASEDGRRAGIAIASLLRKSQTSVAFPQEKLHPEQALSEERLAQLIADLDADAYLMREAARRKLTHPGEQAEAAFRRELKNRPTLDWSMWARRPHGVAWKRCPREQRTRG